MKKKLSNEEFEQHLRNSLKHDDMPYISAYNHNGWSLTINQADTQALYRHGYGDQLQTHWARLHDGRPYGYVPDGHGALRNPYSANPLRNILYNYHSQKANLGQSFNVLAESDIPDNADFIGDQGVRVKGEDYITGRKVRERSSGRNILDRIDLESVLSLPKSIRHEELRNVMNRVESYAIPIDKEVVNYVRSVPSLPHNAAREVALSRAGDMPDGIKEKFVSSIVRYNSLDRTRYSSNLEKEMSSVSPGASLPVSSGIDKEGIRKQVEARMLTLAHNRTAIPRHRSREVEDEDIFTKLMRRL